VAPGAGLAGGEVARRRWGVCEVLGLGAPGRAVLGEDAKGSWACNGSVGSVREGSSARLGARRYDDNI